MLHSIALFFTASPSGFAPGRVAELLIWPFLTGAILTTIYNRLRGRKDAPLPIQSLPKKPILQVELAWKAEHLRVVLAEGDKARNLRDAGIGNAFDTFLFIPSYLVLLVAIGLRLAHGDGGWRVPLMLVALASVPLAAICDWLENNGISKVLDKLKKGSPLDNRDATRISTPSLVKWTTLTVILLVYGVAATRELRIWNWKVAVVAVLGVALGLILAATLIRYAIGRWRGKLSSESSAKSFSDVLSAEDSEIEGSRRLRFAEHIAALLDCGVRCRGTTCQRTRDLLDALSKQWLLRLPAPDRTKALATLTAYLKGVSPQTRQALVDLLAKDLASSADLGSRIARATRWPLDVFDRPCLGLAFSGGGIRSATFNLGILQELARDGVLHCIDYLSTVSGGGYIGAWLSAWLKRRCFSTVENSLKPEQTAAAAPGQFRPVHEIEFLRQYSNYLTPQVGALTADTWTMVAIYLRNTLLNLTVLVALLMFVIVMPQAIANWHELWCWALSRSQGMPDLARYAETPLALVALALAATMVGLNFRRFGQPVRKQTYTGQSGVIGWIVIPIFIAAYLWSRACHSFPAVYPGLWVSFSKITNTMAWSEDWRLSLAPAILFFVLLMVIAWTGGLEECFKGWRPYRPAREWFAWACLWSLLGSLLGLVLMRAFMALPDSLVWGTPLLVIGVLSSITIFYIGLLSRDLPDDRREWFGRLGAWLLIFSLLWMVLFGVSLYGYKWWLWSATLRKYVTPAALLSWAATTAGGLFTGASANSTTPVVTGTGQGKGFLAIVGTVAPYVFVAGLFLILAVCSIPLTGWLHSIVLSQIPASGSSLLLLACAVLVVSLSARIDINEFSMHHFYKNRLARCYLGASHEERRPNAFTGFDAKDDFALSSVSIASKSQNGQPSPFVGPYPIINTTLNLVHGDDLAWQERKGSSFVFTPKFSGYEIIDVDGTTDPIAGYRETNEYAYGGLGGIHLGTATSVSGAAANPNMGSDSSPALSFLMTVFNVRLGWWLGNPRQNSTTWYLPGPRFGLIYLLSELFGLTNDRSRFINLSDGGHFENLGIYELVRRRCRFIIACDAEEDAQFSFGGLGNAIRKCRTDFGADVQIDVSRIRHDAATSRSQSHCVVGRVVYNDGSEGKLLYLKASLTGDEPTDVLEYDAREPAFPHQSTPDQWFDESQFESYRKLGIHIAETTFAPVIDDQTLQGSKEGFFKALEQAWYPPSAAIEKSFTKHAQAYEALMKRLGKDHDFAFLDEELFPGAGSTLKELALTGEQRRSAFYFCSSLIQLMENVYVDLKLQDASEREHPYNKGWLELFRKWAKSRAVRDTWRISGETYGALFRKFYEDELAPPGEE